MPDPILNGRRYDQLTPGNAVEASNDGQLWAYGPPAPGELKKVSTADVKTIFQTYNHKFVADGSEVFSVVISALAGKSVLLVVREGAVIFPTDAAPDSLEFTWDGTTLLLGAATNPGERFAILYKTA